MQQISVKASENTRNIYRKTHQSHFMTDWRHQQTLERRYIWTRCGPFLKLQDSYYTTSSKDVLSQWSVVTPSSMTKRELKCTTQVHQPQWGRPLTYLPSSHTDDEFVCASCSVFRLFMGESGHGAHLECSSARHATVINHSPLWETGPYKSMQHPQHHINQISAAYRLIKKIHPSTVLPFLLPFLQKGHTESLGRWL